MQKTFRQEVQKHRLGSGVDEFLISMEYDAQMEEELLKANLMDVEESVLIIQKAERSRIHI